MRVADLALISIRRALMHMHIDPIEHDYNIALDVLKPSKRDLEYGLALHREALVVESYSLGLHAPLDSANLQQDADTKLDPTQLRDRIEDMKITRWTADPVLRTEYQTAWQAAGVTCVFQNAGSEGNSPLHQLRRLAHHTFVVDNMPEMLCRVTGVDDIAHAHREGKHCICLTTNGIPLAGDQIGPAQETRFIRLFAQLGVRMMHLTYNRRNLIGDGCAEATDAGLSAFGHHVIREMNRQGVIVDLAHTGRKTSIDAARASSKPVVISHGTVLKLGRHRIRGKTDDVMRAVVDSGGTVGITNVPAFLGRSGDIAALLDHIDYVVKTFGADAVTIGTDRSYKSRYMGDAERVFAEAAAQSRWDNFWPPDMPGGEPLDAPAEKRPRQLASLSWTNWPLFTVGLVQRGHSDDTIRKVIGANMLRVAADVWQKHEQSSHPQDSP